MTRRGISLNAHGSRVTAAAALVWLATFTGCAPAVSDEQPPAAPAEASPEVPVPEIPILGEFLGSAINANAAASDTFGITASISGTYAVAGVPPQSVAGVTSGSAYVYRYSGTTWGEEFRLTIAAGFSPTAGDDFGRSVDISGDYLIVGSPGKSSGVGAAYIFERTGQNTWGNEVQLQDAPSLGDSLGSSVAISGNYAVVAASGALTQQGQVYVYERIGPGNAWSLAQVVTGSDSLASDQFGRSLDLSGTAFVVGAYIGGNGKAYVFRQSPTFTWNQEAIIASTDFTAGDNFGSKVAIDGDTIAVTARNHNGYGSDRGAVYFYQYAGGTWGSPFKTIPAAVQDGGEFGTSVSISGNNAVVSAFLECGVTCAPGVLSAQGALYAFHRSSGNTWDMTQRIVAPDAVSGDRLGFGLGLSGTYIASGAAFASPGGLASAGKLYFFR